MAETPVPLGSGVDSGTVRASSIILIDVDRSEEVLVYRSAKERRAKYGNSIQRLYDTVQDVI